MQMLITFLVLIIGVITYFVAYKSTIIDPIENIKKLFINTSLILTVIFLALTLIANKYSKKETDLIKRLSLITLIATITMLTFLAVKWNLDTTYTDTKFSHFYEAQKTTNEPEQKNKIDIGIRGISLKTEKEYYISECRQLYDIFTVKSYGALGIQLLLILLLTYQIIKLIKMQSQKQKLEQNDLVVYDDEENVKM